MTITVIGHGYVGLVSACVFADFGNNVYVIGHTSQKIEKLRNGDPLIYEPGLKELLEKNLLAKRILFTTEYEKAISSSDIVFIAVGTPSKANGDADLGTVFQVAEKLAPHLKKGFTVVSCKSTVPVGTNRKIEGIINQYKPKNAEVAIASCPEFLREGTAIYDTLNADRVVIGSDSHKAINFLLKLHKPMNGKRVITNLASAELIKYASNAVLATKISFANLISFYCEKAGADVENVLDAVGMDKRIGRIFMDPGVGYGGACFPKDVKAIINIGKNLGIDPLLFDAVEKINYEAKLNFAVKIMANTKTKKVAIWGLSFKPNTDDIREAPSLFIIGKLLDMGFKINVYDPVAESNVKKVFDETKIKYFTDPYKAVDEVSALIILTEWNEFKQIDLEEVKKRMKDLIIFDGRNIYDHEMMKSSGFSYYSIGRPPIKNI